MRTRLADALWLVPVALVVLWFAKTSLSWRILSDTPMMMYQAFLMDAYGWVPYRDFFDMNMLGSYASYLVIGKVFGYGDVGLRIADLTVLTTLSGLTVLTARRLTSTWAGVAAALLFALWFLRAGPLLQLQREFLATLPIAAGAYAAWSTRAPLDRAFPTGLAFGLAATIKPDLALGAVPLAALLVVQADAEGRAVQGKILLRGTLGLAIPALVVVISLIALGAIGPFFEGLPYLKLYGGFGGNHQLFASSTEHWLYKLRELIAMRDHALLVALAVLGLTLGAARSQDTAEGQRLASLGGLLAVYAVYPVFGGHFWAYHWIPMVWCATLATGVILTVPLGGRLAVGSLAARALIVLWAVQTSHADHGFKAFLKHGQGAPHKGRADRIAAHLKAHMEPGDTVQPLDWVSGGVAHGLLRAEAQAATRYIYAFHFYHHTKDPYIRHLRADFLDAFREARPRFVVEGRHNRPYFKGPGASDTFPELERLLETHYTPEVVEPAYTLWHRKDGAP